MKNTMVMAKRMMNDVRASGAKLDTMDDLYAVVSNYADISKAQFADAYNQVNAEMGNELSDCELDMVVGGGVGDFFQDHWKEILIGAAIVLVCTAAGACLGGMLAVGAAGEAITGAGVGVATLSEAAVGTASATSLAVGYGAGSLFGAGLGAAITYSTLNK